MKATGSKTYEDLHAVLKKKFGVNASVTNKSGDRVAEFGRYLPASVYVEIVTNKLNKNS